MDECLRECGEAGRKSMARPRSVQSANRQCGEKRSAPHLAIAIVLQNWHRVNTATPDFDFLTMPSITRRGVRRAGVCRSVRPPAPESLTMNRNGRRL